MNPITDDADVLAGRLLRSAGPLYRFQGTLVPLHHNTVGLSKSIDYETGLLLKNFVEYKKPDTVVELGSFRGYSTAWLMLGTILNKRGHVHAFEVFKEGGYGSMWYDDLNFPKDRFTYHEIPGGVWKYEEQIPKSIDLLFHDTQHLPGPTQRELELLVPRIPVGGMVIVDDMCYPEYRPMAAVVNEFFVKMPGWNYEVLRLGHGLGIAERIS